MVCPHLGLPSLRPAVLAAAIAAAFPVAAYAAEDDTLKQQIETLRKEVNELRETLKKRAPASKEEVSELRKEVKDVARSASEWTGVGSAKHFSGYADVGYTDRRRQRGNFDSVRFNPAFHYQYQDLVLLDAELEMSVQPDGTTETGLEFASINLLLHDYATLFAGKFNSALGQFRQNLHPSWINKLPSAPVGFGHDQAAPTAEVGMGVRGGVPVSSMFLNYAAYVGNGPKLELNAAGDEIEMIGTEGTVGDSDGKKVWGGRVGLIPIPRLEIGLSGATGKVAVERMGGTVEAARDYRAGGADFSYQLGGLDLRGEYVRQRIGDQALSVAPRGGAWKARYLQAAYRFLPTKWEGAVRYGDFRTPHADQDQKQWALGVNYLFAPNLIGKVAYEANKGVSGTATDDNRVLLQLSYGF